MKTLKKKIELVKVAKEHRKFDRFIQGQWINGKIKGKYSGCFFGCMVQSDKDPLTRASEDMELPLWLVHLSEKIFEGLKQEEAVEFPVQLLEAVPVRKDLEEVYKKFLYTTLMDKKRGQITFTKKGSDQYKAIKQCADLFKGDLDESAARSAESAARSAARSAGSAAWSAWSAARSAESAARSAGSAARSAAWSAGSAGSAAWSAWSAAGSAGSAAWSAESAGSAAWSAARTNYYSWMRDLLIKLLKES